MKTLLLMSLIASQSIPVPEVLCERPAEFVNPHNTEVLCIANAVFHEARGEPVNGQEAVAWTIVHRMQHSRFPETACDVVWQPGQFEWTQRVREGGCIYPNPKSEAWLTALAVAEYVFQNQDRVRDCTPLFFYNPAGLEESWLQLNTEKLYRIGNHRFSTLPGTVQVEEVYEAR